MRYHVTGNSAGELFTLTSQFCSTAQWVHFSFFGDENTQWHQKMISHVHTADLRSSWNKDYVSAEICRAQVVLETKCFMLVYFIFRCGVVLIGLNMPASPLRPTHTVPWNTGKLFFSFFFFLNCIFLQDTFWKKSVIFTISEELKCRLWGFKLFASPAVTDQLFMNHQTLILTWDFLLLLLLSASLASCLPPRLILSFVFSSGCLALSRTLRHSQKRSSARKAPRWTPS